MSAKTLAEGRSFSLKEIINDATRQGMSINDAIDKIEVESFFSYPEEEYYGTDPYPSISVWVRDSEPPVKREDIFKKGSIDSIIEKAFCVKERVKDILQTLDSENVNYSCLWGMSYQSREGIVCRIVNKNNEFYLVVFGVTGENKIEYSLRNNKKNLINDCDLKYFEYPQNSEEICNMIKQFASISLGENNESDSLVDPNRSENEAQTNNRI